MRPPGCHPAGAAFRLCTLSSRPHLLLFRSGVLCSTWHTFPPVRSATTHHSGPCCPLPAPTGFLFPCRACFRSVFKCVFAPPAWPPAPHGMAKAPLFGPPTATPQGPAETGRSGSRMASCPHHPLRSQGLCRRSRTVVSTEKPGFRTVPRSSPCRPPGRRAAGPGWRGWRLPAQTGFPGWTVVTPVGVRPGRGPDEPRVGLAGDPPAS